MRSSRIMRSRDEVREWFGGHKRIAAQVLLRAIDRRETSPSSSEWLTALDCRLADAGFRASASGH